MTTGERESKKAREGENEKSSFQPEEAGITS